MDSSKLAKKISAEILDYSYSYEENYIGNPAKTEWIKGQLTELQEALVSPYRKAIMVADDQDCLPLEKPVKCELWVVAHDKNGCLVCFDQRTNEYMLASQVSGPLPTTFAIRGDLVGTFMAR